jgi:hypothetical protein
MPRLVKYVLTALAALALLASSATAAKLVTSKDVKNGSLKEVDLRKGVRAKLNRPMTPGPIGPQGLGGLPGLDSTVPGPQGANSTVPGPAGRDAVDEPEIQDEEINDPDPDDPDRSTDCAGLAPTDPPRTCPGEDSTVPGPVGPQGEDSTVPGPAGSDGTDCSGQAPTDPPRTCSGADSTVPGPQGEQGEPGRGISDIVRVTETAAVPPSSSGSVTAEAACPDGLVAVSGGFRLSSALTHALVSDRTEAGTGWIVTATDSTLQGNGTLTVVALCA